MRDIINSLRGADQVRQNNTIKFTDKDGKVLDDSYVPFTNQRPLNEKLSLVAKKQHKLISKNLDEFKERDQLNLSSRQVINPKTNQPFRSPLPAKTKRYEFIFSTSVMKLFNKPDLNINKLKPNVKQHYQNLLYPPLFQKIQQSERLTKLQTHWILTEEAKAIGKILIQNTTTEKQKHIQLMVVYWIRKHVTVSLADKFVFHSGKSEFFMLNFR